MIFRFTPASARELTWTAYDRVLRVNLHAPVFLMSRAGGLMADQGYGRIVNITSIHGRLSEPLSTAYDVSKAGLEAATRTLAVELGAAGVLANAVAPGFVATAMSVVDGVNELESDWFRTIYVEHARLPLQQQPSLAKSPGMWRSWPARPTLTSLARPSPLTGVCRPASEPQSKGAGRCSVFV